MTGSTWPIGAGMAIFASVASNLGTNYQKLSFSRNALLPREKQRKYFHQPMWVFGLGLVVFGSLFDFAALSLAAQSIVAPIASVTLVANVFFAHYWLGETISMRELGGTVLIVIGSVIAVAFGDHSTATFTVHELISFAGSSTFVVYIIFAFCLGMGMYSYCRVATPLKQKIAEAITRYDRADAVDDLETMQTENGAILVLEAQYVKYEKIHPFCLCALSGLFGGQSLMFGKIVSELFSTTLQGNNQLFNPLFPLALILMVTTVVCQVHFLAVALNFFDALYCVPVFQCFFISVSTIGGASFFGEFSHFNVLQGIFFPLGLLMTLGGVLILSSRKMGRHLLRQHEESGSAEPLAGIPLTYAEDPNRGWYGITYSGEKWKENTTKQRTVIPFPVAEEEKRSPSVSVNSSSSRSSASSERGRESQNPFETAGVRQSPVVEPSENPFERAGMATPASAKGTPGLRVNPGLAELEFTPLQTAKSSNSANSTPPTLSLSNSAASTTPPPGNSSGAPTPSSRSTPVPPNSLPSTRGVSLNPSTFSPIVAGYFPSPSSLPRFTRTPSVSRSPDGEGPGELQSPVAVPPGELPPPIIDMFNDETVATKVRRFTSVGYHVNGLCATVPFVTAFAHAYAMKKEDDQRIQAEQLKEESIKGLEADQAEMKQQAEALETGNAAPLSEISYSVSDSQAPEELSKSPVALPIALPVKIHAAVPTINPPPEIAELLESGPVDMTIHSRMKMKLHPREESFPTIAAPPRATASSLSSQQLDVDESSDILSSGSANSFLTQAESAANQASVTVKSVQYAGDQVVVGPFGLQSAALNMKANNNQNSSAFAQRRAQEQAQQAQQAQEAQEALQSPSHGQASQPGLESDSEADSDSDLYEASKQAAPSDLLPSIEDEEDFEAI